MHRLKLFVKLEIICSFFFNKFEDNLLYSQIHINNEMIIIGMKYFKVENCLFKRNNRDFFKIAIKVGKKRLYGLYLLF